MKNVSHTARLKVAQLLVTAAVLGAPLTAQAVVPAAPTGWTQIYAEDFSTNIAVGGFVSGQNSRLTSTSAAYSAYGDRIKVYPDGWGGRAKYFPSKTMSVSNSCLDIYLHTETLNSVATPLSGALIPILPTPNYTEGSLYGRASARVRVTGTPTGYGGVFMFWQDSDTPAWPAQGEIDFPEGRFTNPMGAFAHNDNATSRNDQVPFDTTAMWSDWHIVTTEWTPSSLKFYVDGTVIGTVTARIPDSKMHYMFQCGAATEDPNNPNYDIPVTATGHVQIDWIAIERPTKLPNGTYKIVPKPSGKVADIANSSSAEGAPLQQWTDYEGDNQRFTFTNLSGDIYKVINVSSGKAITMPGSSGDGVQCTQATYTGATNQQWQLIPTSDGFYSLKNVATGQRMDLRGGGLTNGTALQQWPNQNNDNQKFSIT